MLEDVTASLVVNYGQTSFNQESQVLSVGMTLENEGTYSIHGPLVVAIANLSDPSVQVVGADGTMPEGLPYVEASDQLDVTLDPTEQTGAIALMFNNPNGVQFTYDLVVLARTNLNPVITSRPDLEIIGGQTYDYQVPIGFSGPGGEIQVPETYAVQIVIYVEGGGYPIPASGKDYIAIVGILSLHLYCFISRFNCSLSSGIGPLLGFFRRCSKRLTPGYVPVSHFVI